MRGDVLVFVAEAIPATFFLRGRAEDEEESVAYSQVPDPLKPPDIMFHGVLTRISWGGTVLPSNFVFGKNSARVGRKKG